MHILVYEFATGEGHASRDISAGMLSEGFGMLRSVISDFKRVGHKVSTILSRKLSDLNPPVNADLIFPVESREESRKAIKRLAVNSDATLIIASESGGTLQNLTRIVEKTNAKSLNAPPNLVDKVSDKGAIRGTLKENGLTTPESRLTSVNENKKRIVKIARDLKFPVVIKPIKGVGCEGLSLAENRTQIFQAVEKVEMESGCENFLIQRYLNGKAASIILLSDGRRATPITLNSQNVRLGHPGSQSSYLGGTVPFPHEGEKEALDSAKRAVESFEGLKGPVGVDMVLTGGGPIITDINPRLTTSYIGARKVVDLNLAQEILDVALNGKVPEDPKISGFASFSKIEIDDGLLEKLNFRRFYTVDWIFSPPFPISDGGRRCALLLTCASTFKSSRKMLERSEAKILSLLSHSSGKSFIKERGHY